MNAIKAIIVVVAILLVLLIAISNFLIDFAFNPRAPLTMKSLMTKGGVEGVDFADYINDTEELKAAFAWYQEAKQTTQLTAQDGATLLGWHIPAQEPSRRYVVLCHGYTGEPSDLSGFAYHFYQRGYNVLLPVARAHERNSSTGYIQMGWQDSKDLVGWCNQIVAGDSEARIVILGTSMGGAEVMMASGWDLPSNVACIVEDCGYSSVWDELALQFADLFHIPSFPLLNMASFFNKLRVGYSFKEASATAQLAKAQVPMLFIHGTDDQFVPFSMLQKNFDACASADRQMLAVEGAGHCMSSRTAPELYWSTVDKFVDACV